MSHAPASIRSAPGIARDTAPGTALMPTPGPGADLTWAADRFFWGMLDAPGLRRAGVLPPAMTLTLAEIVPVPVDDLHAVMSPLEGTDDHGRVLVCAARRSDLEPLLANACSLRPAAVPAFLQAGGSASQLNLLVGAFEPIASRRRRHRGVTRAAMLWTCFAVLVGVGFIRREGGWSRDAAALRQERLEAVQAALPGLGESDLRAEVERLERLVQARDGSEQPTDISGTLAAFLRSWPTNVRGASAPPDVQSITINSTRLALSVLVEGDPSPFLDQLRAPEGWLLTEPRLTSLGPTTRLSLELAPRLSKEAGQ